MDGLTPQQVGQPLLEAVQPQQPSPQEILAQIGKQSMESIARQKEQAAQTQEKLASLKDKKQPLNLTPFALAVDAMTGSKFAPTAQNMYKSQASPTADAQKLEELLRRQQGAITDDEINLLKAQYQQTKGGDMSFADKEALRHKYKMAQQGDYFDLQKQIAKMKIDAKKKDPTVETPISKAQEKMDIEWGKKNADYYNKTRPKIMTNLTNLRQVQSKLGTKDPETGGFIPGGSGLTGARAGMALSMGPTAGAILNQDAAHAYDMVRQVVQQDLRETLGAQFTENEGKMMIAATYNPALSEEKNAQNLETLINKVQQIAEIKDQEHDYFEKNQTLRGIPRKEMRKKMDAVLRPFIEDLKKQKKRQESGEPDFENMSIEEINMLGT